MKAKDIYEVKDRLEQERQRKLLELEHVNQDIRELMELCNHEVVFQYHDNHPRKMILLGTCYCPACGKKLAITAETPIQETPFKDSRIIVLKNISLLGTEKTLRVLREEVKSNMDIYYSPNSNLEELSSRMEGLLQKQEYDYDKEKTYIKKEGESV